MKKKIADCEKAISEIYPVTDSHVEKENVAWYSMPLLPSRAGVISIRLFAEDSGIIMIRKFLDFRPLFCVFRGQLIGSDRWFFDDMSTIVEWTRDGLTVRSKSFDERRIKAIQAAGGRISTSPKDLKGLPGSPVIPVAVLSTKTVLEAIL